MGFSKNDFEKVDLRIKKITEQTVEQIEIDSELPPIIEPTLSWQPYYLLIFVSQHT